MKTYLCLNANINSIKTQQRLPTNLLNLRCHTIIILAILALLLLKTVSIVKKKHNPLELEHTLHGPKTFFFSEKNMDQRLVYLVD